MRHPDGLLAVGGDLTPTRLLNAYRHGIFPWYSKGQPILWWSPDPRAVFRTDGVRLSSRFLRGLRHCDWTVRADSAFAQVIETCAHIPRPGQRGTWIIKDMIQAYGRMHELGHAHSFEVFAGGRLVGGIYGIAVGRMFFGESMFSAHTGGSKVALAALARHLHGWGWPLIDAQVENEHLMGLGAERWSRRTFLDATGHLVDQPGLVGPWTERVGDWPACRLAEPGRPT